MPDEPKPFDDIQGLTTMQKILLVVAGLALYVSVDVLFDKAFLAVTGSSVSIEQ